MDKLVRRVTRVERSGQHRDAKVVYRNDENEEDDDEAPHFHRLERSIRHMLKAQLVAAQEAYQQHLESAEKGGNSWLYDGPRNFLRARRKAMKELRLASPFHLPKFDTDEDDED
jgi:hypothetical protein